MDSPKRHYWILGITAIAAGIPVIFAAARLQDSLFRDDLLSNLAATVVGLIVGIPVALELNRRQQAAEERRIQETRAREEAGRKRRVVQLLRKELQENLDALDARHSSRNATGKRVVLLPALKNELWRAFSDGGELEWVQDPDLIDKVADAYHGIRGIIYLEERFFEASHFPGMQVAQPKPPRDHILDYLTAADPPAQRAITAAMAAIDAALA